MDNTVDALEPKRLSIQRQERPTHGDDGTSLTAPYRRSPSDAESPTNHLSAVSKSKIKGSSSSSSSSASSSLPSKEEHQKDRANVFERSRGLLLTAAARRANTNQEAVTSNSLPTPGDDDDDSTTTPRHHATAATTAIDEKFAARRTRPTTTTSASPSTTTTVASAAALYMDEKFAARPVDRQTGPVRNVQRRNTETTKDEWSRLGRPVPISTDAEISSVPEVQWEKRLPEEDVKPGAFRMIGSKREDSQLSELNDRYDQHDSIRLGSQKYLDSAEEDELQAEIVGEYMPVVEAKLAADENDNFFRSPGCLVLLIFGAIAMTAAIMVPPKLGRDGDSEVSVPAPPRVRPTGFPTTAPSQVPTVVLTTSPTKAPSDTLFPTLVPTILLETFPLPPTPAPVPMDPAIVVTRQPTLQPSTLIPTLPPLPPFDPSSDGIGLAEVVAPIGMGLVLVTAFVFLWNRHRIKRAKRRKAKVAAQ